MSKGKPPTHAEITVDIIITQFHPSFKYAVLFLFYINKRNLHYFLFSSKSTMSAAEAQLQAEDVIDNVSLPQGKRKAEDSDEGSETANKSLKLTEDSSPTADVTTAPLPDALQVKQLPTKGRENRLEQNRKAARESRRRKKVMIEELQRSVIFFSRANGALKQQNDELTRQLMQAQMHVAQHKQEGDKIAAAAASPVEKVEETPTAEEKKAASEEQKKADTVATQAIFESQGFPAAAARAAAQAVNGSLVEKHAAAAATASANNLPAMQPGATMQAMANFQQAAAAAMQQAMGQMKGVPGLTQMAATPVGSNPQHAFTDGKSQTKYSTSHSELYVSHMNCVFAQP